MKARVALTPKGEAAVGRYHLYTYVGLAGCHTVWFLFCCYFGDTQLVACHTPFATPRWSQRAWGSSTPTRANKIPGTAHGRAWARRLVVDGRGHGQ